MEGEGKQQQGWRAVENSMKTLKPGWRTKENETQRKASLPKVCRPDTSVPHDANEGNAGHGTALGTGGSTPAARACSAQPGRARPRGDGSLEVRREGEKLLMLKAGAGTGTTGYKLAMNS